MDKQLRLFPHIDADEVFQRDLRAWTHHGVRMPLRCEMRQRTGCVELAVEGYALCAHHLNGPDDDLL